MGNSVTPDPCMDVDCKGSAKGKKRVKTSDGHNQIFKSGAFLILKGGESI